MHILRACKNSNSIIVKSKFSVVRARICAPKTLCMLFPRYVSCSLDLIAPKAIFENENIGQKRNYSY